MLLITNFLTITFFAGMLMDLLSPLFPSAFILVVCLGSISRSFTGVASGATRAALTQHFALQNNAADIAAKEGSQETVATMIGMVLGMLLARFTIHHSLAIWICFLSLTVFHMYANYKAVRSLSLTSLNCQRSSIILLHFLETGQVLSPQQVSVMEHVLPSWTTFWSKNSLKSLHTRVQLGVRISSLDSDDLVELRNLAATQYKKGRYLLLERNGKISIVMHKVSSAADVLQAFIHALVLGKFVDEGRSARVESQSWIDKHYEHFDQKLQSCGWKTGRLLSPSIKWRASWPSGPLIAKLD